MAIPGGAGSLSVTMKIMLKSGEQQDADVIHGCGANHGFKGLNHRHGIQQRSYDVRDREVARAVADWLMTEEIHCERSGARMRRTVTGIREKARRNGRANKQGEGTW